MPNLSSTITPAYVFCARGPPRIAGSGPNMARMAPRVVTRPRWLYHYWRDGMPFEISNTRPVEAAKSTIAADDSRFDAQETMSHDGGPWEDDLQLTDERLDS